MGLRDLFRRQRTVDTVERVRARVAAFQELLRNNNRALELMGDAEEMLSGDYVFDNHYLCTLDEQLAVVVQKVVENLRDVVQRSDEDLSLSYFRIREAVLASLQLRPHALTGPLVLSLDRVGTEQAPLAGEKMARLGELRSRLHLPIPNGFVVTASAFDQYFSEPELRALATTAEDAETDLGALSVKLQQLVEQKSVPSELHKAIKRAARRWGRRDRFVVRSSAVGEDGELSFAGLHHSVINVPRSELGAAYLKVVASLYGEAALHYRRLHSQPIQGTPMAVGCMTLVDTVASGVLYTFDPTRAERDVMLVNGSWGLGTTVVGSRGASDHFVLSRSQPSRVVDIRIANKLTQQLPEPAGGIATVAVPTPLQSQPCVDEATLLRLAHLAQTVERHMRCPQDIEWAVDRDGKLWLLQARPLRVTASATPTRSAALIQALAKSDVLMSDRGQIACRGIGTGPVVVVESGGHASPLSPGSVLVTRFPSPGLATMVPAASAIVADSGSVAGHLATIAREYRIPTIVGTGNATRVLKPGQEITVDAEENRIYAGTVAELVRYGLLQGDAYRETQEFRILRRMLAYILPLHLRDPTSSTFQAKACTSYHDVIRYAHERALMALSEVGGSGFGISRGGKHMRRLALDIPLDLALVDVGGGIAPTATASVIALDELSCRPLRRLLDALTVPGVWANTPADMDLNAFMASATRAMPLTLTATNGVQQNLAIVSNSYFNLSLRLGYHFNVIDAYLGDGPEDSYLRFRFVGGVTDIGRRTRRAELLCEILQRYGFAVSRTGDLVVARLTNAPQTRVEEYLYMLGRLVGYTRQLDILLRDDATTQRLVLRFLEGQQNPSVSGKAVEGSMADAIRVMVLDDEPTVGERLKDYLDKQGVLVETFVDSQTAIDRLDHQQFDVVVTDLKMQGPTGIDVLVEVRKRQLPTEVIIITAYANCEDARAADAVGAYEFIHKPFRLAEIYQLIKKAARKAKR